MSTAPAVATRATHEGRSVIDSKSPLRLGLGFLAGTAGIDGSLVALTALSYEATMDVIRSEEGESIFDRQRGQSYVNQGADIMMMMIGVYLGKYVRDWYEYKQALKAAPSPPPAAGWL
jgi:hypothetical protein